MLQPLADQLSTLHPTGLNPDQDYSVPWILRSKLIMVIRNAGITRLKIKATTLAKDLHQMFPDANEWMQSMVSKGYKAFLDMPLKDFMVSLKYKHPPELLTMFFCLFGDPDVLGFSLKWLKQHKKALRAFRIGYRATHGVEAHPCILLHAFKKTLSPKKRPAAAG